MYKYANNKTSPLMGSLIAGGTAAAISGTAAAALSKKKDRIRNAILAALGAGVAAGGGAYAYGKYRQPKDPTSESKAPTREIGDDYADYISQETAHSDYNDYIRYINSETVPQYEAIANTPVSKATARAGGALAGAAAGGAAGYRYSGKMTDAYNKARNNVFVKTRGNVALPNQLIKNHPRIATTTAGALTGGIVGDRLGAGLYDLTLGRKYRNQVRPLN